MKAAELKALRARILDDVNYVLPLTVDEIATMSGETSTVVARVLRQATADGDVEQKGRMYRLASATTWPAKRNETHVRNALDSAAAWRAHAQSSSRSPEADDGVAVVGDGLPAGDGAGGAGPDPGPPAGRGGDSLPAPEAPRPRVVRTAVVVVPVHVQPVLVDPRIGVPSFGPFVGDW